MIGCGGRQAIGGRAVLSVRDRRLEAGRDDEREGKSKVGADETLRDSSSGEDVQAVGVFFGYL